MFSDVFLNKVINMTDGEKCRGGRVVERDQSGPSSPKHMDLQFVHRWHLLAAYGTRVRHDGVV